MFRRLSISMPLRMRLGLVLLSVGSSACVSPHASAPVPLPTLKAITRQVDLEKFMGDWYVIAHIPTFIETQAYNAVENYALSPDGTIATTFTFNQGRFDGPLKTYRPRGFIYNRETNAEWRMQFVWPFKAPFLILDLSPDYQTTIIGVPDRKYAWIMARTKALPEKRYAEMVKWLSDSGHDVSKLRKVPQR